MYGVPDWYLHAVVKLSNPDLVDIYVEQVQQKPFEAVVLVDIWQKEQKTGSTDFELHLPAAPASCGNRTVFRTNIIVGCPSGKSLSLLDLGNIINGSTPVYMLPVNYRPPSSLGHDIALSPHVYNVDPSQPLRSSHFEASKTSYNFKQCKGKLRRSDCNCTEDMRATGDVAHTDCIDRAYEHYFGNPYALRFVLTTESGGSVPAVGNCTFLEVNNRTDFIINSGDSGTGWFVVHPEKSITFRGSGLYHFLFEIVSRESFCHLNLYLLVFVSKQPMTKAAESFVNILSTFLCGVSLLCVYFCYKRYHKYFHHHHLHPHH
jgi:cation channel sperm-associated protein subunit beta